MIQAKLQRILDQLVNDVVNSQDDKKMEFFEQLLKQRSVYISNQRYALKQRLFQLKKGFKDGPH